MIVETDALEIGYGGILRQRMHDKEQLARYHSSTSLSPQKNYSTMKKEFYLLYFVFPNFKMTYSTKNFSFRLITNLPNMFYEVMLRI